MGDRISGVALATLTALTAWTALTPEALEAQAEADALAAVEQVFEGMRRADPAMVRAVFAADARFSMVDTRRSPPGVGVQDVQGWLDAIGESDGSWDERIYDVQVLVDGDMASVWAPYTFYLNGAVSHCGINSIELLHDGRGWKITQISDTRRSEDCPDPLGA